jgi:hypothetical protein
VEREQIDEAMMQMSLDPLSGDVKFLRGTPAASAIGASSSNSIETEELL